MPVTSDAPSTTPAALSDLHSVHGSLEARVMQKLDALSARARAAGARRAREHHVKRFTNTIHTA